MSTDPLDELGRAQHALGRAIDQARAGEDKQLGQLVRDHGEQVVRLLNGLQRLTRIHDPRNAAFDHPLHELAQSLAVLADLLGAVRLICVEGQVYVNDIRVRLDEKAGSAVELTEQLARHGAGGLTFFEPLDAGQLRALTFLLAAPATGTHARAALVQGLADAGLTTVSPIGSFRLRVSGEQTSATGGSLEQSMRRASAAASDAWTQIAAGRLPNPAPIRRVVAEIVDASASLDLLADDAMVPDPAGSAYAAHCRRVCAFSVVIGRAAGLPIGSLADLGVAAMFHDAGYARGGEAGPPDFDGHPMATLRVLLRQRGFHAAKLRRQLAALDHHRPYTQTPTLFGRILHIADDFDTLTRTRPDGPLRTPTGALDAMSGAVGTAYDPALFQLFVNTVGRYPAGTLLRLTDGRVVVTVSGGRDQARWALPVVRVVQEADGSVGIDAVEIDLASYGTIVGEVVPGGEGSPQSG